MPVLLEPNIDIEIALAIDANKPLATRPRFISKSKSTRDTRIMHRSFDAIFEGVADDKKDTEEMYDLALSFVMNYVTGWVNMGDRVFSRESLEDVLTDIELFELCRLLLHNQSVNMEEKKS